MRGGRQGHLASRLAKQGAQAALRRRRHLRRCVPPAGQLVTRLLPPPQPPQLLALSSSCPQHPGQLAQKHRPGRGMRIHNIVAAAARLNQLTLPLNLAVR